jgi:hypothetical protein
MDEEIILPDDFETIENEINSEETPYSDEEAINEGGEHEEAQPQAEAAPQQDFLKVKYNHEERSLNSDEARELAQLGLYHRDKFQENVEQYKYFEDLARKNNMTLNDLVTYYKNQEEQNAISDIMDYNEVTEDVAAELLEARRIKEQFKVQEEQRQAEELQKGEIMAFLDEFQGVELKDIPKEVFVRHQMGVPLKYAYLEHKYQELNQQNQILKRNENNRKSAPITSAVSSYGYKENTTNDPFLEGFGY